jgi:hypothetical protein
VAIKKPVFWDIKACNRALLAAWFVLVSCLAYSSTLKMEAICFSEISVDIHGLHDIISPNTEISTLAIIIIISNALCNAANELSN